MEVRLEFMITDGGFHVIEGDIDEVPSDYVHICHRLRQESLCTLKVAMNVGDIDDFHAIHIGIRRFLIKNCLLSEDALADLDSVLAAG
jgi:hypothetical protein